MEQHAALGLWVGLNLLFGLILALNVTRMRFALGVGIGPGESDVLQRAVRAHGNNIEYTPLALLALVILVMGGLSDALIHVFGASLLLGRVLHAIGIQNAQAALPLPRVIGNVVTWSVLLVEGLLLVLRSFGGF